MVFHSTANHYRANDKRTIIVRQRDEAVVAELRVNGRDPMSEQREQVALFLRRSLRMLRLVFTERLSFCSLTLVWIWALLFLRRLSITPLRPRSHVCSWSNWSCQRRYCLTGAMPS
jgi:hypothetical protein